MEPDVILLSSGGPYDTLTEGDWAGLTAVQQGRYYEIPGLPLRLDEFPAVGEPGAGHLVAGESAVPPAV